MTYLNYFSVLFLLYGNVHGAYEFKAINCNVKRPDGIMVMESTDPPPYIITMDSAEYYPGNTHIVTIQSMPLKTFENAMLMTACMMCSSHGVFSKDTVPSTTLDCDGQTASSIFPTTASSRTTYRVKWTPGFSVPDALVFEARVVYNETTWWEISSTEYTKALVNPVKVTDPPVEPAPETTQSTTKPEPARQSVKGGSGSHLINIVTFASSQVLFVFRLAIDFSLII